MQIFDSDFFCGFAETERNRIWLHIEYRFVLFAFWQLLDHLNGFARQRHIARIARFCFFTRQVDVSLVDVNISPVRFENLTPPHRRLDCKKKRPASELLLRCKRRSIPKPLRAVAKLSGQCVDLFLSDSTFARLGFLGHLHVRHRVVLVRHHAPALGHFENVADNV